MTVVQVILRSYVVWLLVALCACASEPASSAQTVDIGRFAQITVPAGYQIEALRQAAPDFFVYDITTEGRIALGIYVGNAPEVSDRDLTKSIKIGGCDAKINISGDSTKRMDALLHVKAADGFPSYFHIYFRGLPRSLAQQSLDILSSTFALSPTLTCYRE